MEQKKKKSISRNPNTKKHKNTKKKQLENNNKNKTIKRINKIIKINKKWQRRFQNFLSLDFFLPPFFFVNENSINSIVVHFPSFVFFFLYSFENSLIL